MAALGSDPRLDPPPRADEGEPDGGIRTAKRPGQVQRGIQVTARATSSEKDPKARHALASPLLSDVHEDAGYGQGENQTGPAGADEREVHARRGQRTERDADVR